MTLGELAQEGKDTSLVSKTADIPSFESIPGQYGGLTIRFRQRYYPVASMPAKQVHLHSALQMGSSFIPRPDLRLLMHPRMNVVSRSSSPSDSLTRVLAPWLDTHSMEVELPLACGKCNATRYQAARDSGLLRGRSTRAIRNFGLSLGRSIPQSWQSVLTSIDVYTKKGLEEHMERKHSALPI